ncbi:MAG: hypothetical protein K8T25_24465 [Planctomycetia bacterium]|nr:hypothetical protein [Planctomycetia bacterium]
MSLSAIGVVAWLTRRANLPLEPSVVKTAGNSEIDAIAAVAAHAVAGFLWFNRHPARWFMGVPARCRGPRNKSK